MCECWLSVDEVTGDLRANPDTISNGVTRKGMPERKVGRLWKFPAREVKTKGQANRTQSRTLATLRDTLLPKLLSAEKTARSVVA